MQQLKSPRDEGEFPTGICTAAMRRVRIIEYEAGASNVLGISKKRACVRQPPFEKATEECLSSGVGADFI